MMWCYLSSFISKFSKNEEILPFTCLKSDELCVFRAIIILMDEHNEYQLTKLSLGNAQNILLEDLNRELIHTVLKLSVCLPIHPSFVWKSVQLNE